MSEFKNKIKQNIISPAAQNRRQVTVIAKVMRIDEKNNTCTIEYIDKDGYKSNKDNVPVKIYMPGIIGWFPKAGDLVNVDHDDLGNLMITSKNESGYMVNMRTATQPKKDILSSSFNDTIGGYIF